MSEELMALCKRYFETFGDTFPTVELLINRSDDEGRELVQRCLDAGKTAEELGLYTVSPEIKY